MCPRSQLIIGWAQTRTPACLIPKLMLIHCAKLDRSGALKMMYSETITSSELMDEAGQLHRTRKLRMNNKMWVPCHHVSWVHISYWRRLFICRREQIQFYPCGVGHFPFNCGHRETWSPGPPTLPRKCASSRCRRWWLLHALPRAVAAPSTPTHVLTPDCLNST